MDLIFKRNKKMIFVKYLERKKINIEKLITDNVVEDYRLITHYISKFLK